VGGGGWLSNKTCYVITQITRSSIHCCSIQADIHHHSLSYVLVSLLNAEVQ
jgi:hypothetical protein